MLKNKLKRLLHFAPVYVIWTLVKRTYRLLHKGFTAFKALLFYMRWAIKDKKKLYGQLSEVKGLKPFRPLRWKHGVCYFIGELDGKKVFIKTGGELNTTEREVYAMKYAAEHSDFLRQHIPAIYSSSDSFLIEESVEGHALSKDASYVDQLYEIYTEMKKLGVLHLDIRPDNFIVKDDGSLMLIDFGFALVNSNDLYTKIEKTPMSQSILKKIGSNYAPKNGTVDDAYSMLLTMKYVDPSLLKNHPDIWREMNVDIGERSIELS